MNAVSWCWWFSRWGDRRRRPIVAMRHALSELLWINRERLLRGDRVHGVRTVHLPGEEQIADRRLTAMRERLVRRRTQTHQPDPQDPAAAEPGMGPADEDVPDAGKWPSG